MRTIHVHTTIRPNVCPICGIVEHVHVTSRSRRRNVAEDRWALTPLGQALLDGLRALAAAKGGTA